MRRYPHRIDVFVDGGGAEMEEFKVRQISFTQWRIRFLEPFDDFTVLAADFRTANLIIVHHLSTLSFGVFRPSE